MLVLLSGCSEPAKSEEAIVNDLQANQIFISTDTKISDYEIIKRQTDVENKTDLVYITVYTNAPELTSSLTYELKYELYNEGWILESVMRYWDGPWEFSGLSDEQILADIKDNDYYFSDWDLDVESVEVVEETCDSNAMVYYQKQIVANLIAHNAMFDYYSSYNIYYGVIDGTWEVQTVETRNRRYAPTYSPNISSTDGIISSLKLDSSGELNYDSFEYLRSEEAWDDCFETRYYVATKNWWFGTESYLVSIPLHFSLENGEESSMWTYSSDEIGSALQGVDWNICGEWTCDYSDISYYGWSAGFNGYAIVDLCINDVRPTADPEKFALTLSCDARCAEFYSFYCKTDGNVEGNMIQVEPGRYRIDIYNLEGKSVEYPWCGMFYLTGISSNSHKQGLCWCYSGESECQLQRII